MMLPFAMAAESFTRMLGENEEAIRRRFQPLKWIIPWQKRWDNLFGGRSKHKSAWRDIGRLTIVMIFYGLVFSLLDKTWRPFSLKGLILFLTMTFAYGIVGVADDIMQWRAIHKWKQPADLSVRPTNIWLAIASTAITRAFSLVPGLMFGTPEALRVNEEAFSKKKRNHLLKISASTFSLIGIGSWIPTIAISLLLQNVPSETIAVLLQGLEAFLLVVFAVTLENIFVQMLGFPGGFGMLLKRKNRWLWLGCLVAVTALFLHTLVNPRGELVQALQEGNVIAFLTATAIFVSVVFMIQLALWLRQRHTGVRPHRRTPR
jgi:hypothetical protein